MEPANQNATFETPPDLAGIEEQARQMLALLMALFPGVRITQDVNGFKSWTVELPDGRAVRVRARRDFWDTCERCGAERQRIRKPGGGAYTYSLPPGCWQGDACRAELFADFEVTP